MSTDRADHRSGARASEAIREQSSRVAVSPESLGHEDGVDRFNESGRAGILRGLPNRLFHQSERFDGLSRIFDALDDLGGARDHGPRHMGGHADSNRQSVVGRCARNSVDDPVHSKPGGPAPSPAAEADLEAHKTSPATGSMGKSLGGFSAGKPIMHQYEG